MKKPVDVLRKSDRVKECDPDILKDLRDLYGATSFKSHMKRMNHKKKRTRRIIDNSHLDGVLGLASLIREAEPTPCRAATHVIIAQNIRKLLNKSNQYGF